MDPSECGLGRPGEETADNAPSELGAKEPAETPGVRYVLAGYLGALLASSLLALAALAVTGDSESPVVLLAGQLGFWAVLAAAIAYPARRLGLVPALGGLRLNWRIADLPLGATLGVAAQLVVVPLIYLPLRSFVDSDELARPARELLGGVGGAELVVMGVAVVVVAPVVEELFFRGLLLGTLRRKWGTGVAIGVSSVVFGMTHFQPLLFVALTAVGAIFAGAAVRTGRLAPAIAVHAGFNATTFVVLTLI